jgi:hypothetical protein
MLAVGALLGGSVTVGMAAILLHVGPRRETSPRAVASLTAPSPAGGNAGGTSHTKGEAPPQATLAAAGAIPAPAAGPGAPRIGSDTYEEPAAVSTPAAVPAARTTHGTHGRLAHRVEDSNSLSLEASLITEARAALVAGDPMAALRKARAARSLPVRQLVPEELTVEAQALRALGRDGEANSIDQILRAQYPESALAR